MILSDSEWIDYGRVDGRRDIRRVIHERWRNTRVRTSMHLSRHFPDHSVIVDTWMLGQGWTLVAECVPGELRRLKSSKPLDQAYMMGFANGLRLLAWELLDPWENAVGGPSGPGVIE